MLRTITREIGGSALARAALAGSLPNWYAESLRGTSAWRDAALRVAAEFQDRPWLDALRPAFHGSGAAAQKLDAAAEQNGLVVTGGQQSGLFGGPMYVLHKAITLLEMSRSLEALTGLPVAPVFWAATDDADFVEASHVSVVRNGRLDTLVMAESSASGISMAATPLGDVSSLLRRLEDASGSPADSAVIRSVRTAYSAAATVGSAYLELLRTILQPLGVSVLDASHPVVRSAGNAVLLGALSRAAPIAEALGARAAELQAAGFHPQVAHVPNLSLVFETLDDGTRRRVPVRESGGVAGRVSAKLLGANVLLRPIVERQILPTVSYVGGPGEIAYFAQVSVVADVLEVAVPRIVPRWSGTVIEPETDVMMRRLDVEVDDFRDPHSIEGRYARAAISTGVKDALANLRKSVMTTGAELRADGQTNAALDRSVASMQAGIEYRLARLERRYAAAIKRRGTADLRDIEHLRAELFPNGAPQERVLSFVPFMARYGAGFVGAVAAAARTHVETVIQGG